MCNQWCVLIPLRTAPSGFFSGSLHSAWCHSVSNNTSACNSPIINSRYLTNSKINNAPAHLNDSKISSTEFKLRQFSQNQKFITTYFLLFSSQMSFAFNTFAESFLTLTSPCFIQFTCSLFSFTVALLMLVLTVLTSGWQ